MHISLIGLSVKDKKHWSHILELHGFVRFSCSDFITKDLKKDFCESENLLNRKYLEVEREVLKKTLSLLKEKQYEKENVVIDTTANLIFLEKEILEELRQKTTMIFLDTPFNITNKIADMNLFLEEYKKLAHVRLNHFILRRSGFTAGKFIQKTLSLDF